MAKRGSRKEPAGPRRRSERAGPPKHATYAGAANDFATHYALMSVPRLQMASWLAVRGPATARELQRGLGLAHYNSAYKSLYGMLGVRFVAVTGHPYGALWEITEDGQKWLWRFGWVSARIDLGWHDWTVPEGARPWEIIARDVVPMLLRPSALCVAYMMRFGFARSQRVMAEDLGLPEPTVRKVLDGFARLGWIEGGGLQDPHPQPLSPRERGAEEDVFSRWDLRPRMKPGPRKLHFGMSAYPMITRHVEALRVMALMSGYTGWENDHFLKGEDRAGWIREWEGREAMNDER